MSKHDTHVCTICWGCKMQINRETLVCCFQIVSLMLLEGQLLEFGALAA